MSNPACLHGNFRIGSVDTRFTFLHCWAVEIPSLLCCIGAGSCTRLPGHTDLLQCGLVHLGSHGDISSPGVAPKVFVVTLC